MVSARAAAFALVIASATAAASSSSAQTSAPGCATSEKAARQRPNATNLAVVAKCHAREGKTATAWAEYGRALAQARREHNQHIVRVVGRETHPLEGKLSHLTITLSQSGPEITVTQNNELVPTENLGVPMIVDPGSYEIVATGPSQAIWSTTVTVGAGSSETVTIPALEPAEKPIAPTGPLPEKASTASSAPSAPPAPPRATERRTILTPEIATEVGIYRGQLPGVGVAVVMMLALTYDVLPWLHVFARYGGIDDSQPAGTTAFALSNPVLGALLTAKLGAGFFGAAGDTLFLPFGQGGGDTPDPAVSDALDKGRAIEEGGTFDPNYFATYPALVLGYRRGRANLFVTEQLRCSFRTGGQAASPDAVKIIEVVKAHVGVEIVTGWEIFASGFFGQYLNEPSFVVADPTSANGIFAGVGMAYKKGVFRVAGSYDVALGDNPFGRERLNILTLDLALAL